MGGSCDKNRKSGSAEASDFVAGKYDGAKDGYCFRHGARGVGYYLLTEDEKEDLRRKRNQTDMVNREKALLLFKELDTNGDNKLDIEELKRCKQQFLEVYEADGADREFLDATFVKELSKEEFQELYLKLQAQLLENRVRIAATLVMITHDDEVIKALDANHDGVVDEQEYVTYSQIAFNKFQQQQELQEGKWSEERAQQEKAQWILQRKQSFREWDIDGNGTLDAAELEAREQFDYLDGGHTTDGRLDKVEVTRLLQHILYVQAQGKYWKGYAGLDAHQQEDALYREEQVFKEAPMRVHNGQLVSSVLSQVPHHWKMRETEKLAIELEGAKAAAADEKVGANAEGVESKAVATQAEERIQTLEQALHEKMQIKQKREKLEQDLADELTKGKEQQDKSKLSQLLNDLDALDPVVRPYRLAGNLSVGRMEFAQWIREETKYLAEMEQRHEGVRKERERSAGSWCPTAFGSGR